MKITKARIKQLIREEIENVLEVEEEEARPEVSSRRVRHAGDKQDEGGAYTAEEYAALLRQALGSEKATNQVKIKALNDIFPGKGQALLSMLMKGG